MLKIRYAETIFYTLAAGILIALSRFIPQENLVKGRAETCSFLLVVYGGFLLGCALVSFVYVRRGQSLIAALAAQAGAMGETMREIGAALQEYCHTCPGGRCQGRPRDVFALLAATLLGVGARAFFMSQPMRLDEAYTFLYYLNQGRDPFYYNVPNNHVLHTLLAKLAILIGGMQPVAMRFPAFLAGVLCIPVIFFVCKSFNKNAGMVAALGMAVFPYMILYSSMARGYSLIVLLTLLLVLVGKLTLEKPSLAGCVLLAILSALGLLTIPTMAFALTGVYLWLALALWIKSRNGLALLRDFVLPTLALTALLTVIFYTPTLISSNGAGAIFSNQYVDAKPWREFLTRILPHTRQIVSDFFRDTPGPAKYAGFLLAIIGLFSAAHRREWTSFLLIPSILVGGLALFFAKQAIPFVRTWIYLIPIFLLFADLGYTTLTEKITPRLRLACDSLVLIASLVFAASLVSSDTITKYADTGSFPEAATVAKYLKPMLTGNEFIAVMDTANFPLYYYLCAEHAPAQNKDLNPKTVKRYFVVQNSWYKLSDLTKNPAQEIFAYGDATIYTSVSKNEPIWPGFVFECRADR